MLQGRLSVVRRGNAILGVLMGDDGRPLHTASARIVPQAVAHPRTPGDEGRGLYRASLNSREPEKAAYAIAKVRYLRKRAADGDARSAAVVQAFESAPFDAEAISGAIDSVKRECLSIAGYLPIASLVGADCAGYARRISAACRGGHERIKKVRREVEARARKAPDSRFADLAYAISRFDREAQPPATLGEGFDFGKFIKGTVGPVAKAIAPIASFVPIVGPALGPALDVTGRALSGDFDQQAKARRKIETVKKLAAEGNPDAQRDLTALKVAYKIRKAKSVSDAMKKERAEGARDAQGAPRRPSVLRSLFINITPYRRGTRRQKRG